MFTLPEENIDQLYTKLHVGDIPESNFLEDTPSFKDKISLYCSEKGIESVLYKWNMFGSLCAGTGWRTDIERLEITNLFNSSKGSEFSFNLKVYDANNILYETISINGKFTTTQKGKIEYLSLEDKALYDLAMLDKEISKKSNIIK